MSYIEAQRIYLKQSREESRQAAKSFIESLQAKPFPASERIYLTGSDDSIRVPMRKINLTDTPIGSDPDNLTFEPNEAIYVYDCSGPYADPQENIDVYRGLAPMRESWIEKARRHGSIAKCVFSVCSISSGKRGAGRVTL